MTACLTYSLIFIASTGYVLSFFFRGSIAPLVDVFEHEFNANSSQIGFMSSAFWLSYFIAQIPCGIAAQYLTAQFILLVSFISFVILTLCFSLPFNSDHVISPTIIFTISGITLAPILLALVALVGSKLGNNAVASIGGIFFFAASAFLFVMNLLQAWLYQEYGIWREMYYVLTVVVALVLVMFCVINCFETDFGTQSTVALIAEAELDTFDGSSRESHTPGSGAEDLDVETTALIEHKRRKPKYSRFLCGVTIQKPHSANMKKRLSRALKFALINPWNWLLGLHYFAANGIKLGFNGLWLIAYMSLKFGYSRELSTLISGLYFISEAVLTAVTGKLAAKYRKRKIFYVLSGVCLCSPLYIIYCDASASVYAIVAANIISGFATGIASLPFALIREYNDHYECSDIAGGLYNTVSTSAGFIVQWAIGLLMDRSWEQRSGEENDGGDRVYSVQDYDHGFLVIPMLSVIYLLIACIVKETNAETVRWDDGKRFFVRFFCHSQ